MNLHGKGVNPIISAILVLVISITGIGLVLEVGMPAIEKGREMAVFDGAVRDLGSLESIIENVKLGGEGTSRTLSLEVRDGMYNVNDTHNTITFAHEMENGFLPSALCRSKGNIITKTFGDGRAMDMRFQEGMGNETMDCSRYENHGKIHGANWTDTVYGTALNFDGLDDEVQVPDDDSLDQNESFTISAWVNWQGNVGDVHEEASYIFGAYHNYGLAVFEENDEIYLSGGYVSGFEILSVDSNSSLDTERWYHVAFVYDDEGDALRLYIDGERDNKEEHTDGPDTDDHNKSIGYVPDTIKEDYGAWKGYINDVRLYSHALSDEDIQRLSRRGSPGTSDEVEVKLIPAGVDIKSSLTMGSGSHSLLIRNVGHGEKAQVKIEQL